MQTVDVRIGKAIVNPMNSFLPEKRLVRAQLDERESDAR